ncbi:ACP S-malonyltransferase [Roseibacillus ishigakijimensis]|uniref:Malonyl CoA-acyl carrier protein transacylase n=1 Tax=Roseibacillus ishigakijimensis TaxID=454146 RepID=A0A934VML5_9BACT|nr:ACP S-malonyltransferase [Roseibacillus ishigakijimensis]MBK1834407.1 ACP S-malonyltransferase [Roseibacillus ishigakijimensis]
MTNCVLLFAGQGAQKVGMGQDLMEASPIASDLFAQADEVLGRKLSEILFAGPEEELTKTANCQPALFVHGLAMWAILKDACPDLNPVAAAGLSLGEMTAHTAAGSFSFEEGLRVVAQRGKLMDEACAETEGAMAAMVGGDEAAVRELAAEADVDVANLNAPGQIVLSGTVAGIDQAVAGAKARKIKLAKKLKVAGAYHSRLMANAEAKLGPVLAEAQIQSPKFPVVSNYRAEAVTDPAAIRETLQKQVTGSVRWVESMQLLRSEGNELFIELGPGKVLAGLMPRIDKGATIETAGDWASLEALIEKLK